MPDLTSSEFFSQSSLLLRARPTTTRITSKYSVLSPNSPKILKRKRTSKTTKSPEPSETAEAPAPVAFFTLKTYDPASGVCLKYKTDKAAEVGRLVNGLGRLARGIAALPEMADDDMQDVAPAEETAAGQTLDRKEQKDQKNQKAPTPAQNTGTGGGAGGGGGGGGKKKKKGKK